MRMKVKILPLDGTDTHKNRPIDTSILNQLQLCEPEDLVEECANGLSQCASGRLRIIASIERGLTLWEHEDSFSAHEVYVPPITAHHIILHRTLGGNIRIWQGGREESYVVRMNNICIVPAQTPVCFIGAGSYRSLHVTISTAFMQSTLRNINSPIDVRKQLGACFGKPDAITANLIIAMADYADASHGQALGALGDALVVHLLEYYGVDEGRYAAVLNMRQMQVVQDFMMSKLGEIPKLEEVAIKLNMNPITFSRLFKASSGLTPLEFYRELRMKHARNLVETSRRSLTEIAMELGFTDAAHFSKTFRKYWKIPPSALRAKIFI